MGSESDADRDPTGGSAGPDGELGEPSDFDSIEELGDEIVRLAADLEASSERYLELVDDYERLGGFDRNDG